MPSKNTLVALSLTLASLLGALLFVLSLIASNQREITATEDRHQRAYRLTDELRQTSDDLTRMARTYVVTQNPNYERHFREILAIRRGESPRPREYGEVYWDLYIATGSKPAPDGPPKPLAELIEEAGFSEREVAKLALAEERSDALAALETEAMNALAGNFRDEQGGYTRWGPPDPARARMILHGPEYHRIKAEVMQPLRELSTLLQARKAFERGELLERERLYEITGLALIGLTVLFVAFSYRTLRPPDVASASAAGEAHGEGIRRRILGYSIATMTLIALVVGAIAIVSLWFTAVGEQARVLGETAQAQARLIEAVARFDRLHSQTAHAEGAAAATLAQIVDAHRNFPGLGRTGELMLARVEDGEMVFLLERRHPSEAALRIPVEGSELSAPMRRALAGESGSMRGRDYRGEWVLAAYEPVAGLDLGLVAKIDIDEVRAPFVTAGLACLAIGAVLIVAGVLWLVRLNNPLIQQVERREAQFRSMIENSPDAVVIVDEEKRIVLLNSRMDEFYGYRREELLGKHVNLLVPPELRSAMDDLDLRSFRGGARLGAGTELTGLRKDGSRFPVEINLGPMETDEGFFVSATIRDVSERHAEQQALRESEERLKDLLETAPDAVVIVDESRRISMVNGTAERLFGYDRSELVGQMGRMIFARRFQDSLGQVPLADVALGPFTAIPDLHGLHRDGSEFPIDLSLGRFRVGEGVRVSLFLRDISERKRAEQALKESEERFRRIVEGLKNEYVLYSQELASDREVLAVTYVSPSVENVLGYTQAEFMQDVRGLLTDSPDNQIIDRIYAEELEGKSFPPYELEFRHANGQPRTVEVLDTLVFDDDGSVVAIEGIARDITDRKRAAADLERVREAAEAANRAKSAFLANMSHELRTPMNAILGYSEMLMEEATDLGQESFLPDLKKIFGAGKHLLELINDVLDLSKIEAGKTDLYRERFDVAMMIEEVVATITPLVRKNENQLHLECAPDLGEMRSDLTKVRQTLFNLLSNAAKFTQGGTVTLTAQREPGDWMVFRVRDSGIGIRPEKLEHVFAEFAQADDSTTREYGGTGLGLAISRRFCQMMGGDIDVESVVGEGSTFTIRIPAEAPVAPRSDGDASTAGEGAAEAPAVSADAPLVLVVDDDADARDLLRRTLEGHGFRVETAGSGEEGLRRAAELRPLAITLDALMPGMDGWAVLRALKADAELARTPVVMVTMTSDRNLGITLGATEFLSKPVDRDRLVEILQRYRPADGPGRILIVEDDDEVRSLMRRVLEKEGWKVAEASNGRAGLTRMAEGQPALILLDLMMPEMDGFEFVLELRCNEAWRAIPIIVVTAKDVTEEDRLRLNGHVEMIVEKGAYEREDLLGQVRDLVRARVADGDGVG